MTDNIENLLLEHLKRFQSGQDRMERKLDELTRRVSNLEVSLASLIQHLGIWPLPTRSNSLPQTALISGWNVSHAAWNLRNRSTAINLRSHRFSPYPRRPFS